MRASVSAWPVGDPIYVDDLDSGRAEFIQKIIMSLVALPRSGRITVVIVMAAAVVS